MNFAVLLKGLLKCMPFKILGKKNPKYVELRHIGSINYGSAAQNSWKFSYAGMKVSSAFPQLSVAGTLKRKEKIHSKLFSFVDTPT